MEHIDPPVDLALASCAARVVLVHCVFSSIRTRIVYTTTVQRMYTYAYVEGIINYYIQVQSSFTHWSTRLACACSELTTTTTIFFERYSNRFGNICGNCSISTKRPTPVLIWKWISLAACINYFFSTSMLGIFFSLFICPACMQHVNFVTDRCIRSGTNYTVTYYYMYPKGTGSGLINLPTKQGRPWPACCLQIDSLNIHWSQLLL